MHAALSNLCDGGVWVLDVGWQCRLFGRRLFKMLTTYVWLQITRCGGVDDVDEVRCGSCNNLISDEIQLIK